MEWDKFTMAQKFLQRANAIRPEEAEDSDAHDEALALQDIYYDCYMSSFSRDELLKRLEDVISGEFELPEEGEVDEERYRAVYVSEARTILSSLSRGEYP